MSTIGSLLRLVFASSYVKVVYFTQVQKAFVLTPQFFLLTVVIAYRDISKHHINQFILTVGFKRLPAQIEGICAGAYVDHPYKSFFLKNK